MQIEKSAKLFPKNIVCSYSMNSVFLHLDDRAIANTVPYSAVSNLSLPRHTARTALAGKGRENLVTQKGLELRWRGGEKVVVTRLCSINITVLRHATYP